MFDKPTAGGDPWEALERGGPGLFAGLRMGCARAYDRLFAPQRRDWFQRVTVQLATAGLALHLGLVWAARQGWLPTEMASAIGTHFLAALYTPFSFVLFYEVLLLILSIPESTTRSIGKQYEILSLIVIRNVFKDIAEFESVTDLSGQLDEFRAVLLDMGGGLLMFLGLALFYFIDGRRRHRRLEGAEARRRLDHFIERKKGIALFLSGLLFGLAAWNLALWCDEAFRVARLGAVPAIDVRTIFYLDLFTVMIFADALILILSLQLYTRYDLVFRNAAFVASTTLLRFSLAVEKPYDVELGLLSILFGVMVLAVYAWFQRIGPQDDDRHSPDRPAAPVQMGEVPGAPGG